jgi:murein L,D-transpeptidase YafK
VKRRIAIGVLGIIVAATLWWRWPTLPLPADVHVDRVVVRKADRALDLYRGSDLIRSYRISLGAEAIGPKQWLGDGRTPEGNYVIDYHKSDSSFHRALHISYPSPTDTANALSRGFEPGGLIMIHGMKDGRGYLRRLHTLVDWTDGCIAVTDSEIEEISRVVADGTPIRIEP